MAINLETNLAGIKLKNPTVLASGIVAYPAKALLEVANAGAGAVTTKSITLEKRAGHKPQNLIVKDEWTMNAMGLPNPGAENSAKEIEEFKKSSDVPIIVSIAGNTLEDYVKVAEKIGNLGSAIELNLGCPNVEAGLLFGQSSELTAEVVKKVKAKVKVPVGAKLSPCVAKIEDIAFSAEKAGADFITAVNTMPSMAIDIEKKKPILTNKFGGLSGAALKPVALACVYKIYKAVKIPIIGTGGISTGNDAVEFLMAGATALGIGTAIYKQGTGVWKNVCAGIEQYMEKQKIGNISGLTGLAHKVL